MAILVDVNVVFALVNERHIFHQRACAWLDNLDANQRIAICRQVQMGLLRLLCNRAAMDGDPLTLPAAWKIYGQLIEDESTVFIKEPAGILPLWIQLSQPFSAAPKIFSDAYLAALAIAGGIELASFDRDFGQFPGLHWLEIP